LAEFSANGPKEWAERICQKCLLDKRGLGKGGE